VGRCTGGCRGVAAHASHVRAGSSALPRDLVDGGRSRRSVAGNVFMAMQSGDFESAAELFREALELGRDYGNGASVVVAAAGLARLSMSGSTAEPSPSAAVRAAPLLGAVATMRTQVEVTPWPFL
jgi:hypothetical protein